MAIETGFEAELRGLSQRLQADTGRLYTASCDADLGDSRCKVVLSGAPFVREATVDLALDLRTFTVSEIPDPDGWFDFGRTRWLDGENMGLEIEVRRWESGRVTLFEPAPRAIAAGDTIRLTVGCDKAFVTCDGKFANAVNFRGFPHVPGRRRVLRFPDAG